MENIINFCKNNKEFLKNMGLAIIIIILFKIFSYIIAYICIKMFHLKIKDKNKIKNNAFYKPIKNFVFIFGIYLGFKILKLPENIWQIIEKLFRISIICLISNGFSNLFSTSSETFKKLRKKINFKGNDTIINFVSKIIKGLVYIVAGFIIVSELGYNLNGLVAGLGISSVVLALAIQDVAKSILAGACIILDKPFEIGDYILFGTLEGTVEDISFRSTRIRDIDNQIVIVPNSQLIESSITNCSKKENRRFSLKLVLELDTPKDKIEELITEIKSTLIKNNNINQDSIKVYFDTISDNGFDLIISFYTSIINLADFLKFKEEINYALLGIINDKHIGLAYDSKTIYLRQ